jgi:hypothetical protein
MTQLTRDIQLTLLIKIILLTALWMICFNGAVKNTVSPQQWLFGEVKSCQNPSDSIKRMPQQNK